MDDLISRQAAIDALWRVNNYGSIYGTSAIFDAIDVVKALPSAQPEKRTENTRKTHACDLISRQAAIDAVNRAVTQEVASWSLQELPSAQPEQNLDEWCTDCKEYDKERHCCPRFNKVIREALKEALPEE